MRLMKASFLALLVLISPGAQAASTARRAYDDALARTPDIVNGAKLFEQCVACHRSDGSGSPDQFVPAIAGQHWQVLTKQLLDYRYYRHWDLRMAGFSSTTHLRGPQEIADVVVYVNSLQPQRASSTGPGEHLGQGAEIYTRRCASCHGNAAQGDGPKGYPRLAGQQYTFLVRQIHDAVAGRRPFSVTHVQLLKSLEENDVQGVADHLSRLDP
ncbi:MAG: c-type cytochrome [Pseudomonadota bacterium]